MTLPHPVTVPSTPSSVIQRKISTAMPSLPTFISTSTTFSSSFLPAKTLTCSPNYITKFNLTATKTRSTRKFNHIQPSLSAAFPSRPRSTTPSLPPKSFSPRPFRQPTPIPAPKSISTSKSSKSNTVIQIGKFKINISAHVILCLVPLLWASFVICAKFLYVLPIALSPATFNTLRLLVSCLFFCPIILSELRLLSKKSKPHFPHIIPGIQVGFLVFTANILQIMGLKYAPAARSAFINQLSTIFVPLVAAGLKTEPLTKRIAAGAAVAVTGIFLLTAPVKQRAQQQQQLQQPETKVSVLGDGLQLSSAAFTTAYVLRVSHFARQLPSARFVPLSAIKVYTQTGLSLLWLVGSNVWNHHQHHQQALKLQEITTTTNAKTATNSSNQKLTGFKIGKWQLTSMQTAILMNGALVLWAGVMVSALSAWLQTKGQAGASAGEAAVLFAAQPVWTSVFAFLLLGETMQPSGMVGAGLIVGGAVLASLGRANKSDPDDELECDVDISQITSKVEKPKLIQGRR